MYLVERQRPIVPSGLQNHYSKRREKNGIWKTFFRRERTSVRRVVCMDFGTAKSSRLTAISAKRQGNILVNGASLVFPLKAKKLEVL